MKLTKALIAKEISKETSINLIESKIFLESFLKLIKKQSLNKTVKINKFGSFMTRLTPKRIGRNPLTKESYIIHSFKRLNFTSSNFVKKELN